MAQLTQFDTDSERHFAAYLDAAGHRWDRHPSIPGQSKIPDFGFDHSGVQVLCEVKERRPNDEQKKEDRLAMDAIAAGEQPENNPRHFNPIEAVRHSIVKGRSKFKDFCGQLCALVIYNNGNKDTRLRPHIIFEAMLGDGGFQANLNVETGVVDPSSFQSVFLPRGGEMVRSYDPLEPHESLTNISAIVALESYWIPNPLFELAREEEVARQTVQLGRSLTKQERAQIAIRLQLEAGLKRSLGQTWGLTVCTNPFASIPFPDDLFNGSFDARWSIVNGVLMRVFAGAQRLALDVPNEETGWATQLGASH
jgi:hypothetical protein